MRGNANLRQPGTRMGLDAGGFQQRQWPEPVVSAAFRGAEPVAADPPGLGLGGGRQRLVRYARWQALSGRSGHPQAEQAHQCGHRLFRPGQVGAAEQAGQCHGVQRPAAITVHGGGGQRFLDARSSRLAARQSAAGAQGRGRGYCAAEQPQALPEPVRYPAGRAVSDRPRA